MAGPMDKRPTAGFAIKVPCTVQGAEASLFLNFTHHPGIGLPCDHRGNEVQEDALHRGVGFLQIPIDIGSWRKIPRSETAKLEYIIDVVLCQAIISRMMNDTFSKANESFRPHVFDLAMKTVEKSLPTVKIVRQVKLVKSVYYKHTHRNGGPPVEFEELKDTAYATPPAPAPKPQEPQVEKPLIAEVAEGSKKKAKPAVKKGFLNSAKAKEQGLYPEGSAEGVLPENAGDPMGWLPKGLRGKCNIVDMNNPEHQAKQEAVNKQNASQAEMSKMFSGLSFEKPSVFAEDKPDKDEGAARYTTDYSRFDKVEEEADPPEKDNRGYYVNNKGEMVNLPTESEKKAKGGEAALAGDSFGLDKSAEEGFLSEMKGFLNKQDPQDKMGARKQAAKPPAVQSAYPAAPTSLPEPEYTITRNENVQVVVSLPLVTSMKTVELDIAERTLRLSSPEYLLDCTLPCAVDSSSSVAKFKKSTRELVVTIPCS